MDQQCPRHIAPCSRRRFGGLSVVCPARVRTGGRSLRTTLRQEECSDSDALTLSYLVAVSEFLSCDRLEAVRTCVPPLHMYAGNARERVKVATNIRKTP